MRVVDVVNFNSDASCLPAAEWIAALRRGKDSRLCKWLGTYVDRRRRVVLGFTGATVADMAVMNPEAIELVNAHPDLFEVILRPFSHDIALLRSAAGFELNVKTGCAAIEREFGKVARYFLPAEFMLTNSQIRQLESYGIRGTFVNAARFKNEMRSRIPSIPYFVRGIFSSKLRCIPLRGELGEAYLRSLQMWDSVPWNQVLEEMRGDIAFSWRDGESWFFLPRGIERERQWLKGESNSTVRVFLSEIEPDLKFQELDEADPAQFHSYPVHSFSDWLKEFRMLGFLERLKALETAVGDFDAIAKALWFQAINSDVLSAVEKDSPVVSLRTAMPGDPENREARWTIRRSERGFEGEEFLEMLEAYRSDRAFRHVIESQSAPHVEKLRARWTYLEKAFG